MKKYIFSICSTIILLIIFSGCSKATTGDIQINLEKDNIKPGEEVVISIKSTKDIKINTFETEIHYDENIIEKISITNNFSNNVSSESFSVGNKLYIITFNDIQNINANDEIITIRLKLKNKVTDTSGIISISEMAFTDENFDDKYYSGELAQIEFNIDSSTQDEKLYLSTLTYKIGENDKTKYENGDKYLYKVSPRTKISDFISETNLKTNGNISIYNANGEEEANLDELVKTGMKIIVTKEGNSNIELIISVIGDLDSDGEVTAADLAETLKISLLGNANLKEEQLKAIDMDEDKEITAADLADEIKLTLL